MIRFYLTLDGANSGEVSSALQALTPHFTRLSESKDAPTSPIDSVLRGDGRYLQTLEALAPGSGTAPSRIKDIVKESGITGEIEKDYDRMMGSASGVGASGEAFYLHLKAPGG
jgi:hypothetical protein